MKIFGNWSIKAMNLSYLPIPRLQQNYYYYFNSNATSHYKPQTIKKTSAYHMVDRNLQDDHRSMVVRQVSLDPVPNCTGQEEIFPGEIGPADSCRNREDLDHIFNITDSQLSAHVQLELS